MENMNFNPVESTVSANIIEDEKTEEEE